MKVTIEYATRCHVSIYFVEGCDLKCAEWAEEFDTLAQAVRMAERIFDYIYPHSAESIVIWDSNTGEILATCDREEE